ncbi:MAG: hypothetical protein KAY32_17340 [Candidatus Eisenbacteria sp.]|nr:hypothetical protein [Candidatus Eisenbacteria bacterium]
MPEKPATAAGYRGEHVALVRATCLYVATKLGDLIDDLVVVGGLVPSLLIDQVTLAEGADAHVGTMDLDVGLAVALLEQGRYRALTGRLRQAGFSQDVNEEGNPTRQRWKIVRAEKVTIDFLIPPTQPDDTGGKLRDIEADFAAVIAPGLHLAFQDRRRVTLSGPTIMGEDATRDVWVCGPGAYVVLKALAFGSRGENKDAYDLFYVVRNFGSGVEDVAACLRPLLADRAVSEAITILRRDFLDHNGVGPRRVAEFLTSGPDDAIQADVVGFLHQLVERCS